MNISKELKEKLVAACAASGLQNSNQYAMINDEQLKLDEQRIVNQVADFARRVDEVIKSRLKEIYHDREGDCGYITMELDDDDRKIKRYIVEAISEFFYVYETGSISLQIGCVFKLIIYWHKEKGRCAQIEKIQKEITFRKDHIGYSEDTLIKITEKMNSLRYKARNNRFWYTKSHEENLKEVDSLKIKIRENQEELAKLQKQLTLI